MVPLTGWSSKIWQLRLVVKLNLNPLDSFCCLMYSLVIYHMGNHHLCLVNLSTSHLLPLSDQALTPRPLTSWPTSPSAASRTPPPLHEPAVITLVRQPVVNFPIGQFGQFGQWWSFPLVATIGHRFVNLWCDSFAMTFISTTVWRYWECSASSSSCCSGSRDLGDRGRLWTSNQSTMSGPRLNFQVPT